jgi:hypothetical protein
VIRQRGDRHVWYRGERHSVEALGRRVRLEYRHEVLRRRSNRLVRVVYWCGALPVRLRPDGQRLYLVVAREKGKGYCWYLCHLPCRSKGEAVVRACQGYSYRWRLEELHRQVKADYQLERVCVQRYEALKAMNALFWAAMSFLYTRLESVAKEMLFHPRLLLTRRGRLVELFGFIYYKLAQGLKFVLATARVYDKILYPAKTSQLQLRLGET